MRLAFPLWETMQGPLCLRPWGRFAGHTAGICVCSHPYICSETFSYEVVSVSYSFLLFKEEMVMMHLLPMAIRNLSGSCV